MGVLGSRESRNGSWSLSSSSLFAGCTWAATDGSKLRPAANFGRHLCQTKTSPRDGRNPTAQHQSVGKSEREREGERQSK